MICSGITPFTYLEYKIQNARVLLGADGSGIPVSQPPRNIIALPMVLGELRPPQWQTKEVHVSSIFWGQGAPGRILLGGGALKELSQ